MSDEIESESHREAFKKYASKIEDFSSVNKIVLFGSVARGDHGVNSDVDVLVEVEDLTQANEIEDLAFETTTETGISVTPVIVTEDREDSSFLKTVERGCRICQRLRRR